MAEAKVISLHEREERKVYPRRLFCCTACDSRLFKLHRTDGALMVECANCEAFIEYDDL